jgi:hypothetical protein
MVYRPGARERVAKAFEMLGCRAIETGGRYLVIQIDEKAPSLLDNVLYASEVTAEQWSFEQVLADALESRDGLGPAQQTYASRFRREPQRTSHFGIRVGSATELDAILDAIGSMPAAADGLCELEITGVFRPGDPGALSDSLIQAFVRTELCAAGLITLGQHIELQVDLS